MNKVNIWCWAHNKGENLYRGNCFENALLEELEENKKYFVDDKNFKLLFAKLEELKGTQHPQDILDTIFRDNVTIDFNFARQLKLYDIINADCFCSETDIGKALIYLMWVADLRFVLYMRNWSSTNELTVEFELTHCDNEREVHLKLTKGEFEVE